MCQENVSVGNYTFSPKRQDLRFGANLFSWGLKEAA